MTKKLVESDLRPIYKEQKESVVHVLWQFAATNDVWFEACSKIKKWSTCEDNLLKLIEKLMQKLSKEEMEEVAMIMRSLWLRRNQFIFENNFTSPGQVISAAREQIREFKLAQTVVEKSCLSRTIGRQMRWKKPNRGQVKVNWDATIDQKQKKMGIGVVIRDEMGEALTTCCDQKKHVQHSAIAECMALWKAMELCRDLGFLRVVF
ncbi:uncharacterized protein LOC121262053 [Juglans microcarpa x Juglans regia]|uniref:uncharacterized protein LOC121262053 n=1 Tax=Juglans microcarpa x Juglans regia TaxID=2249226 RepID=UPI001B7DCEF2|nr:uncharacterized protein LOC121262053 [Juglans microcarpa x Juglans regia]